VRPKAWSVSLSALSNYFNTTQQDGQGPEPSGSGHPGWGTSLATNSQPERQGLDGCGHRPSACFIYWLQYVLDWLFTIMSITRSRLGSAGMYTPYLRRSQLLAPWCPCTSSAVSCSARLSVCSFINSHFLGWHLFVVLQRRALLPQDIAERCSAVTFCHSYLTVVPRMAICTKLI
jgi:hypothetical protein